MEKISARNIQQLILFGKIMQTKENKVLLVYNTCGIRGDNTDHYIKCINNFLTDDELNYDQIKCKFAP